MMEDPHFKKWLKKRSVEPVAKEALTAWSTKRLLARLSVLHSCMDWIDDQDIWAESFHEAQAAGRILLKGTPKWNRAYEELKEVLSERDHVRRKNEKRVPQSRKK